MPRVNQGRTLMPTPMRLQGAPPRFGGGGGGAGVWPSCTYPGHLVGPMSSKPVHLLLVVLWHETHVYTYPCYIIPFNFSHILIEANPSTTAKPTPHLVCLFHRVPSLSPSCAVPPYPPPSMPYGGHSGGMPPPRPGMIPPPQRFPPGPPPGFNMRPPPMHQPPPQQQQQQHR